MGDGKGRPQAGSCPTQGGLMPAKDGAQPAFILPSSRSGVGRLVQGAVAGAAPFGSAESRELRSRARLRRAGCARLPAPRRDGQRGSRHTRRWLIRYT